MIDKQYTVKEVATILHSSPNYVYELIKKGYLPVIKLGSIKILKTTLETFLLENQGKDLSDLENIKPLKYSELGNSNVSINNF